LGRCRAYEDAAQQRPQRSYPAVANIAVVIREMPIGSGQRSDAHENVLVFKHGHFTGAHDGCYG